MDAQTDGGVAGIRVTADHQKEIGLTIFGVGDGVGHRPASKRDGQTGHRGSVSESGAVIDIVGSDRCPHEFLHQIVFFVGRPGAAKAGNGIRPVHGLDIEETFGYLV